MTSEFVGLTLETTVDVDIDTSIQDRIKISKRISRFFRLSGILIIQNVFRHKRWTYKIYHSDGHCTGNYFNNNIAPVQCCCWLDCCCVLWYINSS